MKTTCKTCKQGHEMTPENTYRYVCKECRKIDAVERYQRNKHLIAARKEQDRIDLMNYRKQMEAGLANAN